MNNSRLQAQTKTQVRAIDTDKNKIIYAGVALIVALITTALIFPN